MLSIINTETLTRQPEPATLGAPIVLDFIENTSIVRNIMVACRMRHIPNRAPDCLAQSSATHSPYLYTAK